MSVNVHSSPIANSAAEIAGVLDYAVRNGNFGAMPSADTIDGTLANSSLRKWTADEVNALISNNVALWMFNGETDGDNLAAQQDVIQVVENLYRQAGKSGEWLVLFVRASGPQSWK